ncbi:hypothetical protein [Methanosarcina mazei]|uniref:hypothetical protein n=1 Tax=Methanosarcina mazei TaxID=2209 RepID=UPI0012D48D01|nr:hypothetical protein [Methanosarcina mazei]
MYISNLADIHNEGAACELLPVSGKCHENHATRTITRHVNQIRVGQIHVTDTGDVIFFIS